MKDVLELEIIKQQIAQYTHFSLGNEMILNTQPIFEGLPLSRALEETTQAMEVIRLYGSLPLGGVHDIRPFVDAALKDMLCSETELMMCASFMRGCLEVKNFVDKCEGDSLHELADSMILDLHFCEKIEACISPRGEIYDHASSKLKSLRRQLSHAQSELTAQCASFIQRHSSKLTDTVTTTRNDRLCVLVKISEKNTVKGFIHGESASGATAYIEPECLLTLNNQIQALKSSEEEEIKRILFELSQEVKKIGMPLIANCETLGKMDAIFAKAQYGINVKGCVATLDAASDLYLKNARHPLIDPQKVVANTYSLKPHAMLLITGSNTGGKSVTLKTIGLFVLMSCCAFPISADEARLPLFDGVFVDIGDEQSIEQSLSTFSAHISKLAMFTRKVSHRSLVILDELGSGTDPKEGEALAIAVLEKFRSIGCMVLASTHYSRLKSVSAKWDEVLCSSVEFDMETMRPTYRYIEGISGASNAFSIAKHFGLDEDIVENARRIKDEGESEDEKMLRELNEKMMENRLLEEKLKQEKEALAMRKKELEEKLSRFENSKEKILEEAKEKADEIVFEAKTQSDEILAQMRKHSDKVHEALQIRSQLDELISEEAPVETEEVFHVKDSVLIKKYNYYGEVLEVKPKYLLVLANGMKMKLDPSDCTHTQKRKEKKKRAITARTAAPRISLECNVIGERVADGLAIIDKYIDSAVANRLTQVRLIHGVGSGAMRNAVWEYLKKNKYVENWRIGGEGEGGTGATVVTLKGRSHGK